MDKLQDFIELNDVQYNTLSAGGTIGSETGLSNNNIYLVESNLNVSNRNLLDNPNFRINQRGKSQYTAVDSTVQFCADRWLAVRCVVDINSDGSVTITPNHTSTAANLRQYFEPYMNKYLSGRKATITVCYKNCHAGEGTPNARIIYYKNSTQSYSSLTMCVFNVLDSAEWNIRSVTFTLPTLADGDGLYFEVACQVGGYVTIDWIKFELSAGSTLYIPPDPTEELMKCQRYYTFYDTATTYGLLTSSSKNYYIGIPLFVNMRVVPTVDTTNYTPQLLAYNLSATASQNVDGQTCWSRLTPNGTKVNLVANARDGGRYNEYFTIRMDNSTAPGDLNNTPVRYNLFNLGLGADLTWIR